MSRLKTELRTKDGGATWAWYDLADQSLWKVEGSTRTIEMGTTSDRITSSAASESKFRGVYEFNHTGGYGWYTRSYVGTAGISADAFRAYATVEDVAAATVRGAHISLSHGSSGTVTGLGVALECTLHLADQATHAGTIAPLKLAINSDGDTSDPSGAQLSYIRIDNQGGDGTADVDDDVYLFDIQGHTIDDGNLVAAAVDETSYSHNIRCRVGGTVLYLMCANDRD